MLLVSWGRNITATTYNLFLSTSARRPHQPTVQQLLPRNMTEDDTKYLTTTTQPVHHQCNVLLFFNQSFHNSHARWQVTQSAHWTQPMHGEDEEMKIWKLMTGLSLSFLLHIWHEDAVAVILNAPSIDCKCKWHFNSSQSCTYISLSSIRELFLRF